MSSVMSRTKYNDVDTSFITSSSNKIDSLRIFPLSYVIESIMPIISSIIALISSSKALISLSDRLSLIDFSSASNSLKMPIERLSDIVE